MSDAPHELLSPVDAAWFRMESRRDPADILSVMVFDAPLDDKQLRAIVTERMLVHRRFKLRVVDSPGTLTPPHWEEEPGFSLDGHLRRVRLERRPDAEADDEALRDLVTSIANEPVDFARSPWNVVVVDGVGREGRNSAMIARLHHCLGDGFALLDILLSLADGAEDKPVAPPKIAPPHASALPKREVEEPHGWLDWASQAGRTARDVSVALGHLLLLSFDAPNVFRGTLVGERRLAWSAPIPVTRVKELARAHAVTINDVLLTILAGAYRRYMLAKGAEAVPFRAIVPVNLRPSDVALDHEHGNWFGLVFLDLPTDLVTENERLEALKTSMDELKASKEAVVALGILAVLGRTPIVVEHLTEELFSRKASVVATNVPGPREPLFVAGARLSDMWFWAPHPCGLGSGASILSYAGQVRVGFRGDAGILPDPEVLAGHFHDELAEWCK